MAKRPKTVKQGTVQKIIPAPHPGAAEKAQIEVQDADYLYKEIRIENTLHDDNGRERKLKEGAEVEVVVEADPEATVPKKQGSNSHKDLGSVSRS